MNGRLLTNPPIAIDYWKSTFTDNVQCYFLTHVHSDHTNGLNSNWTMPIYCSNLTRKIILEKFKIAPEFVHDLKIGLPTILYLDAEETKSMKVTLIDANHCPGSAMFHFEGRFGQILYTGDFKYSDEIYRELLVAIPHLDVDHLYFDDTYWNNGIFPPREGAIKEIITIIENHSDYKILITLYNFGKEYLLEFISKKFKTPICVSEKRKKMLQLIGFKGKLVTNDKESNIQVIDRWMVQKKLEISNKIHPTIAIIPSAFMKRDELKNPNIFVVLLTDHCSHDELKQFIRIMKPNCMTGLTGKFNTRNFCRQSIRKSKISSSKYTEVQSTSAKKHKIEAMTPLEYEDEGIHNEYGFIKKRHSSKSTPRRKWLNCSRCGKRFQMEGLKYNRNKDMYDPGLCSPCDVTISQMIEKKFENFN